MIKFTFVFLRWPSEGTIEAQSIHTATTPFANAYLFIEASPGKICQESRVKRLGQEFSDIDNFTLALQVRERDLGVLGVLPDDLAAGAAGRRQLFGVNHDYQIGEVAFAFRQGLPDRDTLGADGQTIARAFDIAARVDLSGFRAQGRPYQKIRERRERTVTRLLRNLNQIISLAQIWPPTLMSQASLRESFRLSNQCSQDYDRPQE